MKHLIGYTSVSYQIGDVLIPGKSTTRSDKDVATVSEEQLKELSKNSTFKSLLELGSIKVLDTKPSWAVSANEKIQEKDITIKEKEEALKAEKAKTAALEAELAKLTAGK